MTTKKLLSRYCPRPNLKLPAQRVCVSMYGDEVVGMEPGCVVRRWFHFGRWVLTLEGWIKVHQGDWVVFTGHGPHVFHAEQFYGIFVSVD